MKSKKIIERNDCRLILVKIKNICSCVRCGSKSKLSFHHIDPKEKYKSISDIAHNKLDLELLRLEINKCTILCTKCHEKIHKKNIDKKFKKFKITKELLYFLLTEKIKKVKNNEIVFKEETVNLFDNSLKDETECYVEFRSYPDLINHYRMSDIEFWFSLYSELKNSRYIASEKIDGCNIQVSYINGKRYRFGKRHSFIGDDLSFYNIGDAIKDNFHFEMMDNYFKNLSRENYNIPYVIFGELYGDGINKRIYYGPGRYIKFYDVKEGNEFWPAGKSYEILSSFNLYPPLLGIFEDINSALCIPNIFISKLTPIEWNGNKETNFAEGYVIKPYSKDYRDKNGSRFVIKSKNPNFADNGSKKEKKEYEPMTGSLAELLESARTYVNENRLTDLESKLGPIKDHKQISEYMKAFAEDWQNDFCKDYREELEEVRNVYGSAKIKEIFKIGGKHSIGMIKDRIIVNNQNGIF